jgi:hypothetical protein
VTGPISVVGGTGVFGRRLVCGLVATTDLDVIVAARERSVVGAPGLNPFVEALAPKAAARGPSTAPAAAGPPTTTPFPPIASG